MFKTPLLKSRKLLTIFTILILTGLLSIIGYKIYHRYFTPDRFLMGMRPIDDKRALVMFRMSYDHPEPHWRVGVIDLKDDTMIWEQGFPDGSNRLNYSSDALVPDVNSDLALLIANMHTDRDMTITALSLRDGALVWRHDYSHLVNDTRSPDVIDDTLILYGSPGIDERVMGIDIKTGETQWTHEADSFSSLEMKRLVGFSHDSHKSFIVDAQTGETTAKLNLNRFGQFICNDGDLLMWVSGSWEEKYKLERLDLKTQRRGASIPYRGQSRGECGFYRDMMIIRYEESDKNGERSVIEARDRESGEIKWSWSAPNKGANYVNSDFQGVLGFSGRLPRFAPLELNTINASGDDAQQWAIIDLERGQLKNEGPTVDSGQKIQISRSGNTWLIRGKRNNNYFLASINGDTGEVMKAWTLSETSHSGYLPYQLAHEVYHGLSDTAWAFTHSKWTRAENMAVYQFSLPSLTIEQPHHRRRELRDITAEVRARFGQGSK